MNASLFTTDKPLKVKLEKIEDHLATLVFSDRQAVEVNAKFIPTRAEVGDYLFLNFLTEDELKLTKQEVAKEILDDILK